MASTISLNSAGSREKALSGPGISRDNVKYFMLGFALLVAVVAGFYPAHRAANLNPVEALHYE